MFEYNRDQLNEYNKDTLNGPRYIKKHGLIQEQQSQENTAPIIAQRFEKYNLKWKINKEELNKIYEEQKELYNIFHHENSNLS